MVYLKSDKELKIMARAGNIAAQAMSEVAKNIQVGVSTIELDRIAQDSISGQGAQSSFKKVKNYYHTICSTPNDQVVHGIPGDYKIKDGDIIGIDLGAYYGGFHSDMAHTFMVGRNSKETERFLKTGQKALQKAIENTKEGNCIGDVSSTIQNIVESAGYRIVRELVGHGIGKELHEDPMVPGIGKAGTGPKIEVGMVLAIEIIYNMGSSEVTLLDDGWTISTKDGKRAGLFERTVAITKEGSRVLTPMPSKW